MLQHKAKHLVLLDGGRKYLGGFDELVEFTRASMSFPESWGEDDTDWIGVAREQCEVSMYLTRLINCWMFFNCPDINWPISNEASTEWISIRSTCMLHSSKSCPL